MGVSKTIHFERAKSAERMGIQEADDRLVDELRRFQARDMPGIGYQCELTANPLRHGTSLGWRPRHVICARHHQSWDQQARGILQRVAAVEDDAAERDDAVS